MRYTDTVERVIENNGMYTESSTEKYKVTGWKVTQFSLNKQKSLIKL